MATTLDDILECERYYNNKHKKNTDVEFAKILDEGYLLLFFLAQRQIHHDFCFSLRIGVIGDVILFSEFGIQFYLRN